jgi:pyruvate/2-oxoglutarate dehydrogenase complex dihydrolipoamide acyltransferase (E2) component
MRIEPVAPERRHTLHFLAEVRSCSPVHLDTEVEMEAVLRHREAARSSGAAPSIVAYVLFAAARVLAVHPEANAAISGTRRPKVARYDRVNAKLTLDKKLNGRRIVLSAVLPDLEKASLAEIQRQVEHYRDGDPGDMPEFAALRRLHRLPVLLGGAVFRLGVRPLRNRADLFGTFALTSLGHRPVDGFASVGGTTVTLGVGRIADRPVVRDGAVAVAPVMRLNLAFDHRVIDGAEAADVLTEIKDALEGFKEPVGETADVPAVQAGEPA